MTSFDNHQKHATANGDLLKHLHQNYKRAYHWLVMIAYCQALHVVEAIINKTDERLHCMKHPQRKLFFEKCISSHEKANRLKEAECWTECWTSFDCLHKRQLIMYEIQNCRIGVSNNADYDKYAFPNFKDNELENYIEDLNNITDFGSKFLVTE